MVDPVQEFQDSLILRQGSMDGFVVDPPKIALHFNFPKRFEVHFNRVMDYRAKLPIGGGTTIRDWSACRDSEFLRGIPERRLRHRLPPLDDLSGLCHFHMTLPDGYLDVAAEEYVFMMVSR